MRGSDNGQPDLINFGDHSRGYFSESKKKMLKIFPHRTDMI